MFFISIHVFVYISNPSLFIAKPYFIVGYTTITSPVINDAEFTHSSADGHLGCFPLLGSCCEHSYASLFVDICLHFSWIDRSEILGFVLSEYLTYCRKKCQTVF